MKQVLGAYLISGGPSRSQGRALHPQPPPPWLRACILLQDFPATCRKYCNFKTIFYQVVKIFIEKNMHVLIHIWSMTIGHLDFEEYAFDQYLIVRLIY